MMRPFKPVPTAPLQRQIADHLAGMILSEELPDKSRLPSTTELAKHYEVTPVTIHKSLQYLVQRQLIERRPRQGTFVRAQERANVVALAFGKNPFRDQSRLYAHLIDDFQREVRERGMNLKIYFDFEQGGRTMFDLEQDLRSREVKSVIATARVAALNDFLAQHGEIAWIEAFQLDHYDLVRTGVAYMAGRGYRRIAVVSMFPEKVLYPDHQAYFRAETKGMRDGLAGTGATGDIVRWGQTEDDGYVKSKAWLKGEGRDYDALMVCHDVICRGVVMAMLDLGVKFPGDLGLLTHINRGCEFASPVTLSRVELDSADLARVCLDALTSAVGDGTTGQVKVPLSRVRLVPGASCGE